MTAALTGVLAGLALGYVLQRGQLCFHSTFAGVYEGRLLLLRGWALGVALGSVGLAVLYLLPGTDGLNRGLPFRPVGNIVGGLMIGAGMVVARSCVSGLFYKLGAGMLGATLGLLGWVGGELLVRDLDVPGPTLLAGGEGATVPGLLGLPRLLVAVLVLAAVVAWLWRRPGSTRPDHTWQWGWRPLGIGVAVALVAGWALAAAGGAGFGASSVGAVNSVASGSPNTWLLAFLVGLVPGSTVAARTAGGLWVRGEEQPVRYLQLAVGGLLLGAGGWIAGGCNLGHGLSGVAQLNVSSAVAVAAMIAGVGLTRPIMRALAPRTSTGGPTGARV